MKTRLLDLLDAKRAEIVKRHAAWVHRDVLPMRAFALAQIEESTSLMLALYAQHQRAGDSPMPLEIDVLSRDRALFGVSPGDMAVTWFGAVRTARDVVLAEVPDGELREALAAWSELERIGGMIIGWMVERHRKNLEAKR